MNGRYKMRTICERTGFNQALLRAWERRFALLRPARTEGGHRLYTEDDLRVLGRVRELLDTGHAIGEIAALGRARLLEDGPRPRPRSDPSGPGHDPSVVDAHRSDGDLTARVQRIAIAAARIDEPEVEAGLDAAFACLTPHVALDRIVLPALVEVGMLWNAGRCSSAGEHLLSSKVVGRLHGLLRTASPVGASATHAVFACLPGEAHEIGALTCAYTLARQGCRVTYLGASLPFGCLRSTVDTLRPNLVCLSVARPSLLGEVRIPLIEFAQRIPAGVRLALGGAGVQQPDPELAATGALLAHPGGPTLVELLA